MADLGRPGGGRFFEDFALGEVIRHPTPRTLHGGDLSLYIGLTGDVRPLSSSTEFAKSLGFARELARELLAFHTVFGKSVRDVSTNAIANLGYADVRFSGVVYPGDTLRAQSEVIELKQSSSEEAGVVYVTTRGFNQKDQECCASPAGCWCTSATRRRRWARRACPSCRARCRRWRWWRRASSTSSASATSCGRPGAPRCGRTTRSAPRPLLHH